jgi:hypothetical protein
VLQGFWQDYETRAKADHDAGRHDPHLEDFRWLIEELRVSLSLRSCVPPCRFPRSGCRSSGTSTFGEGLKL